jgi:hypothetical protein
MPLILTTWEAEIRKISDWGQPQAKVRLSNVTITKKDEEVAQVVNALASMRSW